MRSVGILGGGESGVGAALLAKKYGYEILLSDSGEIVPESRKQLIEYQIPFEEKGHTIERLDQLDVIVKSPGISNESSVITELDARGCEIISEIEWAYRHCRGSILAVTGSNGKTTTAMLCHHLLVYAAIDAVLCGNVGTSFSRVLSWGEHEWYVVEVSSFQLDDVTTFRPHAAIVLNITPDHLDRYGGDIDRYAAAKFRIATQMQPDDVLVCNADDPVVNARLDITALQCRIIRVRADDSRDFGVPSEALPGAHNALNAACAIHAVQTAGVRDEDIRSALQTFRRPPHRMEDAGTVAGVRYINDSKATNVDSVYYALGAMHTPVIWIAGGQDKGNDYSKLVDLAGSKIKMLVCLGIDNEKLKKAFSAMVGNIVETTDMFEAVSMAASNAIPGETVLLSPACASFDLFQNYQDRGDQFKNAVAQLKRIEKQS